MNILFYVEPWIEKAYPAWKTHWINRILLALAHTLRAADSRCQSFFLIGDAQADLQPALTAPGCKTAVIDQSELRRIQPDYLTSSLEWHLRTYSPSTMQAMVGLVRSKLDGYTPDIVISFMMDVPFLRGLFPDALVLVLETAIFANGAKPYPTNWYLDPLGSYQNSFFRKHIREAAGPLTEEGRKFLALFREKYIYRILRAKTPFTRAQLTGDRPFKHLLLLPLQQARYVLFEGCCRYASPWDLVTDVLQRIDPEIGVVVTEHVHWTEDSITLRDGIDYLRRRYPNFIYHPEFAQWEAVSHLLLPCVDAVAAVSSTVALNAMLWEVPVIALGESQINAIADLTAIEPLKGFLDSTEYRNKDAILYYMLTRYAFLESNAYLTSPQWLANTLSRMLETWRREGVTSQFYPAPYDEPWRILKAYLRGADPEIPVPHSPPRSARDRLEGELTAACDSET